MSNPLILSHDAYPSIENEETFIQAYQYAQLIKQRANELAKAIEEDMIAYMQETDTKSITLADKLKITLGVKKYNRFHTETIYDALGFTDEQRDVLPKNPAFRKGAVVDNPKTAHAYYEEETDTLTVKLLDEKFITKGGVK